MSASEVATEVSEQSVATESTEGGAATRETGAGEGPADEQEERPLSLDVIYTEVKDRLDVQLRQIDALDSKGGTVLFVSNVVLGIGAAAAGVALVAGLAVGVWAATRARPAVDVLAIVPLGIPPLLLGLAYLRFYNRSWPVNLAVVGNTSALVILALAARGWPFVTRAAAAGRRRIAPEWLEAARLGRVGVLARFRRISLPLLADHVAVGAIVAFILAVGDVQITQMLCAPGTGTLALRLFTFLHFGPAHVAAALALLQLSLATVPLLVYFLVTNRWLQVV
jgi:iron(III) transport system permease protein